MTSPRRPSWKFYDKLRGTKMSINKQVTIAGSGLNQDSNNQNASNPVPRDVRLLHLIFATQGIQNYQDHVPLQLMDFAFRMLQLG